MKPVAFIEGQQRLFGFHDDAPHPVLAISSEETAQRTESPTSWSDDVEAKIDRYTDQGFTYDQARQMVIGVPATNETFGQHAKPVSGQFTSVQASQPIQRGRSGHGRRRHHLTAAEQRARDYQPPELNER